MNEPVTTLRPWILFAGGVLVVAVLYWAQAILVPLAVAVLLTFLLTPIASGLERWLGRVPAVLAVVVLAFSVLGAAGWVVARQLTRLDENLPLYRDHIHQKIADIRGVGDGGSVQRLQETLEEIQTEITRSDAPAAAAETPVVVMPEPVGGPLSIPGWIGSLLEPLATGGLLVVLVVFLLLERRDLRDRLIGVIGHGHLAATTKALDEAATRVSRYLLMQSLVNAAFGIGVAIGLSLIGVPHAILWAALAAVLRFIPYVGPWIGAGAPILISLAALPDWQGPLMVIGLFLVLELFTNLVLETLLYADAAGVSQVGLLVSVAFWTWLWGPLGLLLASPLTVCLVVLSRHVAGLEIIATLMADVPGLSPDVRCYQRLLARDPSEASELVEEHVAAHKADSVYDALLVPALNYAERDRAAGRLSAEEEASVIQMTRELMSDAAALDRESMAADGAAPEPVETRTPAPDRVRVLGCPANSDADALALHMLNDVLAGTSLAVDVVSARLLSSEIIDLVRERGYRLVCVADLPPSAPSKTRYLLKKLRAALPDVRVVVGRWAPPSLADEDEAPLLEAGASHVASELLETRRQLQSLVSYAAGPPSDRAHHAA